MVIVGFRKRQTIAHIGCSIFLLHNVYGLQFLYVIADICYFSFLDYSHSRVWEGAPRCGFTLYFHDDSRVFNIFSRASWPFYVFLGEEFIQVHL